MSALILGTLTGLLIGVPPSVVVIARTVPGAPAPEMVTRLVAAGIKDDSWWREELRTAAFHPVPDEPGYWTPGSIADLAEQDRATLRQPTSARPGIDLITDTWRKPTARRVPGATLIGASA